MVDADRILAWELAIKLAGGEDPTPKHVKKAVQEVLGETPEPKPDKKAELRKKLELLMAMVIRRDSDKDCITLEKIKSEFQVLLTVI
jgi:hypothetical protein